MIFPTGAKRRSRRTRVLVVSFFRISRFLPLKEILVMFAPPVLMILSRQVYEMRFHSQNRADRIAEDVARSKECNVPLESFIQAGIEDPQAFVSTAAHRRNVESRLSSTYLSKVFDLAKVKEESKMSSVPVKGRECTSRQSRRARALRALQTQLLHTYRRDNARFLKRGFENGQCIDDSSSCL